LDFLSPFHAHLLCSDVPHVTLVLVLVLMQIANSLSKQEVARIT